MEAKKIYKIRSSQANAITRLIPSWMIAAIVGLIPSGLLISLSMFFNIKLGINIIISLCVFLVGGCVLFVVIRKEGLFLYQHLFRALSHLFNKNKFLDVLDEFEVETAEVDTDSQNLSFIRLDKKIATIIKITPVDYMLIRDDEKNAFVSSLQNFLNNIEDNVQFYISNKHLRYEDLIEFTNSMRFSIENSTQNKSKAFSNLEIYTETIKNTISKHRITILSIYLIIPQTSKTQDYKLVTDINSLTRKTNNIIANLMSMKYQAKLLSIKELDEFLLTNTKLKID